MPNNWSEFLIHQQNHQHSWRSRKLLRLTEKKFLQGVGREFRNLKRQGQLPAPLQHLLPTTHLSFGPVREGLILKCKTGTGQRPGEHQSNGGLDFTILAGLRTGRGACHHQQRRSGPHTMTSHHKFTSQGPSCPQSPVSFMDRIKDILLMLLCQTS